MNIRDCYAALEIHDGADKEEIRQAYRDLVTIWHPDQYQENTRLQEKATEKLKELNTAYDTLMALTKAHRAGPGRHQDAPERRTAAYTAPRASPQAATLKRKHPVSLWLLLLAAVAITAMALYLQLPFPMPGKAKQDPYTQGQSSTHVLAAARLAPEQVERLQRELLLMGYDSGPADGKMGPKTIKTAQQFAVDFQVIPGSSVVDSLLAESSRQAAVTRIHADWPKIARSRDFDHWIENQTITTPDICRDVLSKGSTTQMRNLIDSYVFDKEKPEPKDTPKTGILKKRFHRGMAPLKIKTRHDGRHFFVKLLEQPDQKEVLTTFIRSGDKLKLHIPVGVYALKYAVGNTWYGDRWLFGSETVFSRIQKDIEFSFEGNEISGYSIELYIEPRLLSKNTRDYTFDF